MTIILSLLIGLIASYAAYLCALRKGRHARRWAILCLLVSFSLLFLELLPNRRSPTEPPYRLSPFQRVMEMAGIVLVIIVIVLAILDCLEVPVPFLDG